MKKDLRHSHLATCIKPQIEVPSVDQLLQLVGGGEEAQAVVLVVLQRLAAHHSNHAVFLSFRPLKSIKM